jgi:mRNA interferase MazF
MTNSARPVKRGDVLLLPINFVSGKGSKVRPAVVIQNDRLNSMLQSTVVAIITSTLTHVATEPSQLFIDLTTLDGHATGLLHNSTVKCEHIDTVDRGDIHRVIGRLSDGLLAKLEECLNVAGDMLRFSRADKIP